MKTYSAKPNPDARKWVVVDLAGQRLGRAASQVAAVLRGKHRPTFTPHVDTGDFVVAVNADKIVLTGNKLRDKKYFRHSGFPGGMYDLTAEQMLDRAPDELFTIAVKGMLPKNKLGRGLIKKLKVYAGDEHPHQAQQPEPYELTS